MGFLIIRGLLVPFFFFLYWGFEMYAYYFRFMRVVASRLVRLYLSFVVISSALISSSVFAAVSTEVAAGTTTYRVISNTVSTPSNVALSTARDITPVVSRAASGSLAQAAGGNLIIGQNVSTPMRGAFVVSNSVLKSGAASFFKRTPAGVVLTVGLSLVADSANWEVGADGGLFIPSPTGGAPVEYASPADLIAAFPNPFNYTGAVSFSISKFQEPNPRSVPFEYQLGQFDYYCFDFREDSFDTYYYCFASTLRETSNNTTLYLSGYYNAGFPNQTSSMAGYAPEPPTGDEKIPVTDAQIDAAVNQYYDPAPEDWDLIFPYIEPSGFLVEPIPSVVTPPVTSTTIDAITGVTSVSETSTTYDFVIGNNGSERPSIDLVQTDSEQVYQDGNLVADNTTVTNNPALPNNASPPSLELPSFCSWASVVCDFIDWFRDYDQPEPVDYDSLIAEDFEPVDYTFDVPSGSCPDPLSIDVSFLGGSVEFSFDLICEYAAIIRYLVLMSAYLLSAQFIVRSIR